MGQFLIRKMRQLFDNERTIISQLLQVAECEPIDFDSLFVEVINADTGTLRSTHLMEKQSIKAVADTSFSDTDGVHVEVILFVDDSKHFAELMIWKVDDTPLTSLPNSLTELTTSKKINC